MPATTTDLLIEQGADWSHGWLVTYNGEPIDEGWTARSQVRSGRLSPEVLHEFAADVTVEGAVVLAVAASESSVWRWTRGVYDVEVVSPDGSVTLRVAQGSVAISAEVTR